MQSDLPDALFALPQPGVLVASAKVLDLPLAEPRLRRADRSQVLLRPCSLEEVIDSDHVVRVVWDMVCRWDLSLFLAAIRARGERSGRAATDPRILLCLWLYAAIKGLSNGREVHRLTESHDAYRWICGGVSLNYHTINDFRVGDENAVSDILTQMIAALMESDLVSVERISVDGTRVRAGAGRSSFKTEPTLQKNLQEARIHIQTLKQQAEDPTMSAQRQKAIERAGRERVERIEKAIEEVGKVQRAKDLQKEKPSKHTAARASTTDPESRPMKMPNGGNSPGYNVQFAVATLGRAIVGVDVVNAGSDVHESQPMREQVEERSGGKVLEQLNDGGYIGLESIDLSAGAGTTMYAPVPKPKKEGVDRHVAKKTDSPAVGDWRERMGTSEAKAIYKERASTVETVNGECRTYRGLDPFGVRGLKKAKCLALFAALAYNIVHFGACLAG